MSHPPTQEASTAELIRRLSDQTNRLVHDELELLKAELRTKGKRAGLGAGLFGGAGVFGLLALGALTAAAIAALATAMATWLAALIVAVVWAAVAGVMAMSGKSEIDKALPAVPEDRVDSVKEDVQWTKTRAQEGRR
jgi:hypothetical protein